MEESLYEQMRKLHHKDGKDWYEFYEFYPNGWKHDPVTNNQYVGWTSNNIYCYVVTIWVKAVNELLFGKAKKLPLINSNLHYRKCCTNLKEAEVAYQQLLRQTKYIYDFLHSETGKAAMKTFKENKETIAKLEKENLAFISKVLKNFDEKCKIEESFAPEVGLEKELLNKAKINGIAEEFE